MPTDYSTYLPYCKKAVESGYVLNETSLLAGGKYTGKVRDVYSVGDYIGALTTDRMSAFDRLLACVPFKGQVLNMVSAWWFEQTKHIIPNHIISVPHPNLSIVKRCVPFRVEIIVRAYLTGTTSTSIWMHYKDGVRNYCGHVLPEGLKKNDKLPEVIVTPTTKDDDHDRPISGPEVVSSNLMTADQWQYVHDKALEVFKFGQAEAAKRGLILVDTKYEFGFDPISNQIMIIDEIHTPDSSRYWIAETYESNLSVGKEPDNIDKEFLRIWFRNNSDPYADAVLPQAPPELVSELSKRYIQLYETITGQTFPFPLEATTDAVLDPSSITNDLVSSAEPFFSRASKVVHVIGTEQHIVGKTVSALDKEINSANYRSEFPVSTTAAIEDHTIQLNDTGAAVLSKLVASPNAAFVVAAADSVKAEEILAFVHARSSLKASVFNGSADSLFL